MSAAVQTNADGRRRAMLAKVHMAKKQLGLQEDAYRPLLERVTGKASAGDCTEAQLARVLEEFKRLGWQATAAAAQHVRGGRTRQADHPSAKKARALWISLHQLGVVRDPAERALESFAKRQLGVERLQWADQGQAYRLIEALKAMAERAGWAQDADSLTELKCRLIEAQWRALVGLGVVPELKGDDMLQWLRVRRIIPEVPELSSVPAEHLDALAQSMAARIWKAKAERGEAGQ